MYSDIPFFLSLVFIIGGLAALVWSSDVFIDGAAVLARSLGIPPLVVGMVVIGFGTSAPELCVSVMSGISDHAGISLGNAYGSCIFNISVIMATAVLIFPMKTRTASILVAGISLFVLSGLSMFLCFDGSCSRFDAIVLLACFVVTMPLYCWYDAKSSKGSSLRGRKVTERVKLDPRYIKVKHARTLVAAVKLVIGLVVLVFSSHILVHGSVDIAKFLGVSDLLIGLTIISAGTSLPELASAIQSARKGQHDFVLGNIVGSNIFNMLAVVGIATVISPIDKCSDNIIYRDLAFMSALSVSLAIFGLLGRNQSGGTVVSRWHGLFWIAVYGVYLSIMFIQESAK